MYKVNEVFHSLCNLDTILYAIATIEKLAATQTDLNWKAFTYGIADRSKHLTDYADSVLKRASVLVCTMIEIWREELMQKPSVTCMNHYHLISGTLAKGGFLAISLHNVCYLLL